MESDSDILEALGVIPTAQNGTFFYGDVEFFEPQVVSVDFFDDEQTCIDEDLESDENADIAGAKRHLQAYNKIDDLLRKNTTGSIKEFAIIAGYDYYPIFKIGKSKASGNYIGFISVVSNRYIYG